MSSIKVESPAIPDVCRVCTASNVVTMVNIFNCTKRNIAAEIHFCTGIVILEKDNLPQKICSDCIQQLQVAHKFKLNCLQAEERFRGLGEEVKIEIKFEHDDENEATETGVFLFEASVDSVPDVKKEYDRPKRIHNNVCTKCDAKFCSLQELRAHRRTCKKNKEHVCEKCGNYFSCRTSLYNHKLTHLPPKFFCAHCEYKATTRSCFIQHIKLHTGEKKYKCKYCGKLFAVSSNLLAHVRRIHVSPGKKFPCLLCDRRYKDKRQFERHMLTHNSDRDLPDVKKESKQKIVEKPKRVRKRIYNYQCKRCDAKFPSSQEVRAHRRQCGKHKQHEHDCEICGKHYNHASSLSYHRRLHKPSKSFFCAHCEYNTLNRGDLIKHVKLHTGEKNYQCKYCGKLFTFSSNLLSHVRRIHESTDETRLPCKLCDKRCKDKQALRKHMRTHSNERDFECEVCGARIMHRNNWKKHLKIQHNIIVPVLKAGRKKEQLLVTMMNEEGIKGNLEEPN